MAIEKRIVIDHVFIKFASGEAHQTTPSGEKIPLGSLCGIHQANVEYLVDVETGEVVGRTNNPINDMAQAVAAADLQALLGQQFVALGQQVTRLMAGEKVLIDERDTLRRSVEAAGERLKLADAELAARGAAIEALNAQLRANTDALTEAAKTIDKMMVAAKLQDEELRVAQTRADMAERRAARPALNRDAVQSVQA